ncbi:MAG: GAF domain-containing protein [Alphaproteobacteria bacterium]|nr:MAG: GAF domain-containing protein [Alphaproteobacteria bacterium]
MSGDIRLMPSEVSISGKGAEDRETCDAFDPQREDRRTRELDIWLESEAILARMLDTATEPLGVDEMLTRCLDLVLSTRWLRVEHKGGIFIADEDARELTLLVERNLGDEIHRMCRRVAYGCCLCGRVAASRQLLHVGCVDERHEHRFDGMKPHGHYIVPILSRERLLGVMVLYLPHGYELHEREVSFLRSAANIFAMIIQLRGYQEHLEDLIAERTAELHTEIERRKAQEAALRIAKERAEAADRAKTALLANMSHEFKTPLNATIGFAEMLAREMHGPIGDARYRDYAEDIVASGRRLLGLLEDLLELARARDGGLVLEEQEEDPAMLARRAGERAMRRYGRDENGIHLEIADDLPALICDVRRVGRMLDHLLDNAHKFSSPPEPIALRVALQPGEENEAGPLFFEIVDHGIGMDKNTLARLGSFFWQKDAELSRSYEGAGIGMSLIREYLTAHDGHLAIDSRPGEGTRVRLAFPPDRLIHLV